MKLLLPFLFFLTQTISLFSQNQTTFAERILSESYAKNIFAGAVAGYSIDGKIVWEKGIGFRDLKNKVPMETNTLSRPASIAKSMTAVAILQLVEQGLLDLDQPIQTYLPNFPKKKEGDITTRHLLNHTSGINGYASGKESETRKNYPRLSDAVEVFKDRDLVSTPGKTFQYTSYGYVVLGLIIEKVSGMTYEAYMAKNIWEKVGMKDTGIEIYGKTSANQSLLYRRKGNGKIKWVKKGNNLSNRIPGGGFYTTVEDLLKFGQAILNDELISANSRKMMWENPGIRKKEEGNGYGFGWFLYGENTKYGVVYGHSGGQTGCSAQLMLLPEQQAVIAVMANTSNDRGAVFQLSVNLFKVLDEGKE